MGKGLIHLLTLAARVLALGDYVAAQALAREKTELAGVYAGNPNRTTPRPTMERMRRAFEGINLIIIPDESLEEDDTLPDEEQVTTILTDLSAVQARILELLGLHRSLFSCLASA